MFDLGDEWNKFIKTDEHEQKTALEVRSEKMTELIERLLKNFTFNDKSIDTADLDMCIKHIKGSMNGQNEHMFDYVVNYLNFLLDNDQPSKREESYLEICSLYHKMFEVSNEIEKIKAELEVDRQRMVTLKEMHAQHDETYLKFMDMPGVTESMLDMLLKQMIQLNDEMDMIRNMICLKENQILEYEGLIVTIGESVQIAKNIGVAYIPNVYEQAMKIQNQMLNQNFETLKEMEKIKQHHPGFKETITSNEKSAFDVMEDQYRVLADQMKELR